MCLPQREKYVQQCKWPAGMYGYIPNYDCKTKEQLHVLRNHGLARPVSMLLGGAAGRYTR